MRNSRILSTILGTGAAIIGLLATSATAEAARNLDYGFVEDQFGDNLLTNPDPAISSRRSRRA